MWNAIKLGFGATLGALLAWGLAVRVGEALDDPETMDDLADRANAAVSKVKGAFNKKSVPAGDPS